MTDPENITAAATDTHTRPRVICLCGSMRFEEQMREVAVAESLDGAIVLPPLVNMRRPDPRWSTPDRAAAIKARLDALHLAKIDAAHEVVVVAPGGYIGESTSREIAYATEQGKPIRYAVDGFTELAADHSTPRTHGQNPEITNR